MNIVQISGFVRSLVVVVSLLAGDASASWGIVTGRFLFYQKQGNYCPGPRNCTGARYVESQYQTNMPVADVKVYVYRQSDRGLIGQGVTDANGQFSISWDDPFAFGASPQAFLAWKGEHKDGRFAIKTASGGSWIFSGPVVTLGHGVFTNLATITWGNANSPNPLANLYDGARRTWADSLSQSNRLNAFFSAVEVRAFDSATCPNSCADGRTNIIVMDDQSAFLPQMRVMHEMGHIASYRSSRDQAYGLGADYCFPATGACTWQLNTEEWASAAFEEAVATFFGSVALYAPTAREPYTCVSASACSGSFQLEPSPSAATCQASPGLGRQPISHIRYFWDLYDQNQDFSGETFQRGMWEVADTIHAFDNGPDNRQKDEAFDSMGNFDDPDGRSLNDFVEVWKPWGTDSTVVFNGHCGSAGD